MMEVETIEDLEPDSWEDGTPKIVRPCSQREVEREISAISQCSGFYAGG